MNAITSGELVTYLKSISPRGMKALDKVKTNYRPLICPLDELLMHAGSRQNIFDIGCGNGSFLALTARFCNPQKVAGIEISQTLVDNANLLLNNVAGTIQRDITLYNGSVIPSLVTYDSVFMTDVFHHIPVALQDSVLQQIFDQMKPGALFIMKDIDAAKLPWVYFNKLHDAVAAGEIGNEVSAAQMHSLLQNSGFTILEQRYKRMLWYPHYTFVCCKN